MYLFLISGAISIAITGLFAALDMVGTDTAGLIYGGLSFGITFLICFAVLGRRVVKALESTMKQVEKHLGNRRIEKALSLLEEANIKHGKWHPLVGRQISGQMGQLLYVQGKLERAIPHLSRALRWDWTAQAMLACALHKKREPKEMLKVFEKTSKVRTAKKEPLFWTLYAYLLRKNGNKTEAAEVLRRGIKLNPSEKRLQTSLQALQGGKPLKTNVYGPAWQQFRI